MSSAGSLPFEAQVAVVSMETTKLEVRLDPLPPEPPPAVPLVPVPLVRRPGLYVGGGGLALSVAGVVLGLVASSVGAKIHARGESVDVNVTRTQAKAAATEATLANIMVPLGLAAAAGGAVWFLLQPPVPSTAVAAPAENGGGTQ